MKTKMETILKPILLFSMVGIRAQWKQKRCNSKICGTSVRKGSSLEQVTKSNNRHTHTHTHTHTPFFSPICTVYFLNEFVSSEALEK